MKKTGKLLALALSIAMLLTLAACGSKQEEDTSNGNEVSNEQTDPLAYREIPNTYLSIATGSSGGGWYIMGALFNDAFETNIPGLGMTLLPGGGSSNPTVVDVGEDAQIGFTYITNAKAAVEGTGDYTEACKNLYGLANISVKQYLHLLISANSPYSDLEGIVAAKAPLKFAVGPRAGGNEVAFNRVLKAYGASFEDIESWGGSIQYISAQEGCDAVKDGQIDGNANLSAIPQSNLLELMTSREMKWLPVSEAAGKELADTYGYSYEQLPANTYSGQTEPVDTIVDTVLLVVNGDVSEDVVFNLTKCLCENEQLWADGYEALSAFDPDNAANTGIALHPGAEAYYRAAGYLS